MSAQIIKQAGTTEYIVFVDIFNVMWAIDKEMITYISMDRLDKGEFVFLRGDQAKEMEWTNYYRDVRSYNEVYQLMCEHCDPDR